MVMKARVSILMREALCRDADPGLFDQTEGQQVWQALHYCARCPVTKECEEVVRPRKSFFDGVAGNKVWRNGDRVEPDSNGRRIVGGRGKLTE